MAKRDDVVIRNAGLGYNENEVTKRAEDGDVVKYTNDLITKRAEDEDIVSNAIVRYSDDQVAK